jgi:hypothetical protein
MLATSHAILSPSLPLVTDAIFRAIRVPFPAPVRVQIQQKLARFKQIFRLKSFCKFIVDRLQQPKCLFVPTPALPKAGQIACRAQLLAERSLALCNLQTIVENCFNLRPPTVACT